MVSPQNYWDTTVLWQQYFLISCNLKAKIWTTLNVTYLLRDNHVICSKIWDSLYSPYKLVAIMYIMYHFAEGFASYYENVGLLVCPNIMSAHIFCKDFFVRVGDHSVNRLKDSIILWTSICESKLLAKTKQILSLNKCIILRRKLKRRGIIMVPLAYGCMPWRLYPSIIGYWLNPWSSHARAIEKCGWIDWLEWK